MMTHCPSDPDLQKLLSSVHHRLIQAWVVGLLGCHLCLYVSLTPATVTRQEMNG